MITFLQNYGYPANIRELRNIVERIVILYHPHERQLSYLPSYLIAKDHMEPITIRQASFKEAKRITIENFERSYLTQCLKESEGNMSLAARMAGIHVTHFYSKVKAYNIEPYQFKAVVH